MRRMIAAAMTMRTRKLIGAFALLVAGDRLGAARDGVRAGAVRSSQNGLVPFVYYVLAGIGWVLPAMPLISWMSTPGRDRRQ